MRRAAAVGTALIAVLMVREPAALAAGYDACMRNAGAIDPVMLECQDRELGRQDRALNEVCAALIARLKADPGTTARLKAAERAWITFRDADCSVLDDGAHDGSMDRMALNECIIDATRTRVVALGALETRLGTDGRE